MRVRRCRSGIRFGHQNPGAPAHRFSAPHSTSTCTLLPDAWTAAAACCAATRSRSARQTGIPRRSVGPSIATSLINALRCRDQAGCPRRPFVAAVPSIVPAEILARRYKQRSYCDVTNNSELRDAARSSQERDARTAPSTSPQPPPRQRARQAQQLPAQQPHRRLHGLEAEEHEHLQGGRGRARPCSAPSPGAAAGGSFAAARCPGHAALHPSPWGPCCSPIESCMLHQYLHLCCLRSCGEQGQEQGDLPLPSHRSTRSC